MTRPCRAVAFTGLFLLAGPFTGCHSAFVQATVVNRTGSMIHLFEVDYPSASFGGDELPNGSDFHYRFKVLGTGFAKLTWTDAAQHDHRAVGPELHEGQEGSLTITIGPANAVWGTQLSTR